MGSGDPPGLQNRRAAGFPVAGAFDSHTLPPIFKDSDLPTRHGHFVGHHVPVNQTSAGRSVDLGTIGTSSSFSCQRAGIPLKLIFRDWVTHHPGVLLGAVLHTVHAAKKARRQSETGAAVDLRKGQGS